MLKKHFLIAMLILLSSIVKADEIESISSIDKSTFEKNFQCEEIALPEKMPRVRNQGTIPICFAYSSATIIQYQLCKRLNIKDCDRIEQRSEVSPLSTLALYAEDRRESFSPHLLDFFDAPAVADNVIIRSGRTFVFHTESCFSMDDFIKKHGNNDVKEMKNILASIKKEMKKAKAGKPTCDSCIKKIAESLGTKVPAEKVQSIITEYANTYDNGNQEYLTEKHVLYQLTIGGCDDGISLRPSKAPKADRFPIRMQDVKYEKLIEKVKEVLATGNPLAFDGVCLVFSGNKCVTWHSFVIYGYKKMCSSESCSTKCRDIVQVQNSWGEEWQRETNDGLLDAKILFTYIIKNKVNAINTLSWLY